MVVQKKLKEEYNRKVRRDDQLKLDLSKANGVRVSAVDRWLKANSKTLTTATNLEIISTAFDVPHEELLESEPLAVVA